MPALLQCTIAACVPITGTLWSLLSSEWTAQPAHARRLVVD